jgi:hypothetical protein
MQRTRHRRCGWVAGLVLLALLSACSGSGSSSEDSNEPVKLVRIQGTGFHRVELTRTAVARVGLETEPVTAAPASAGRGPETIVPYAALIYDPSGATWVYTTVGPRAFQRHAITVARVVDDDVILSAGPPVGTKVVTVGAAEVYGSEFLSEHE